MLSRLIRVGILALLITAPLAQAQVNDSFRPPVTPPPPLGNADPFGDARKPPTARQRQQALLNELAQKRNLAGSSNLLSDRTIASQESWVMSAAPSRVPANRSAWANNFGCQRSTNRPHASASPAWEPSTSNSSAIWSAVRFTCLSLSRLSQRTGSPKQRSYH